MSTATATTTTTYRIDLTDIRGVGPTTRDYLHEVGIDSVAALHLLSTRGGQTWRQLKARGVGENTLAHLKAVGTAVEGTNHASVQAGHLTADFADDVLNTMDVCIEAEEDERGQDDADLTEFEPPVDSPDDATLDEALETIRTAYDDEQRGMDAWMDFSSDIADFLTDSDRDELANDFYQPEVQHAVVRYPLPANQVSDVDELEPVHLQALVEFAAEVVADGQ